MTTLGQYLDVQCPENEESFWDMVQTKSSPFFGVALKSGAVFGGASIETISQVEEIGKLYGEMIQIHDDLGDTMALPASPDWQQDRMSLPILFAQSVDHPERSLFLELRQKAMIDEGALCEAQEILIRCGAVSYCVDRLLQKYQVAKEILQTADLARPELIDNLLEEIIAPAKKLFEEIDEAHS